MAEEAKNQKDPTINVRGLVEASIKRLDDIANIRATAREKYVDDKFNDVSEKFKDKDIQYQIQFTAAKEAVAAALAAAKEAVLKAETSSEKRFESVNEFRATLADQQRNLMPRAEVEIINKSINDRVDKIENKIILMDGKGMGVGQGWAWAVAVAGLVGLITGIILAFSK